jgi:ketosteroid isomerase-like protein
MLVEFFMRPWEEVMSKIARFAAYAAAFEKSFASDDWSLVEPFFTEDAVYEVDLDPPIGGRFEGRPAILAYFKQVLDRFDRRFESREIALLEGPKEEGDTVWIRGSATYRAAGVPVFVLELKEIVHFEGDRIRLLEDRYEPAMKKEIRAYLEAHGEKLGIRAN